MSTYDKVKEVLSEFTVKVVEPTSTFSTLKLDSLDTMEIVIELENIFDIELDEDNLPNTIQELVALINSLLN